MRLHRVGYLSIVSTLVVMFAGTAHAELGQATPRYADRSMTLSKGTLRIDGGPSDFGLLDSGAINGRRGLRIGDSGAAGSDTYVSLGVGAAYGIIDGLEVGALVLPLQFAPDGVDAYQNPEAYVRYRFLTGNVEVGAQVGAQVPVVDGSDFGLSFGLPVLVRLGTMGRLDTGAEVELQFADPDMIASLDIPLALNFSVTENILVGGRTGFYLYDFDFDFYSIKLGVQGGYTIQKGIADITAWFQFPNFLSGKGVGDGISADAWEVGVGGNFYVSFLQ